MPRSKESSTGRVHPGPRVTSASEGFLLATKLTAQRAKDAVDVVALAGRLGPRFATPEQIEANVRNYNTEPATLELIIDGHDVDQTSACSLATPPACSTIKQPTSTMTRQETSGNRPDQESLMTDPSLASVWISAFSASADAPAGRISNSY